jgi:hypothetical protein
MKRVLIIIGKPGLSPCCFDQKHNKTRATKTFCVISTGEVCRNNFISEMHVEITSSENILHYFDTPKTAGRKAWF